VVDAHRLQQRAGDGFLAAKMARIAAPRIR
jgi:hypothetical protein